MPRALEASSGETIIDARRWFAGMVDIHSLLVICNWSDDRARLPAAALAKEGMGAKTPDAAHARQQRFA